MGAHRAQRVHERRAPLDSQPLDRVRVVARPGLRSEGEQPGIEAAAAAGARLEQDLGEGRVQARVQVVHAEDVAVEELALPVGRQGRAVRLGDVAVHVPLHVRIGRAPEHVGQDREEVVDDLRAAHVEHELLAALGPRPAGHADRPVRVGLEELAAFGLIISGSIHSPKSMPSATIRSGDAGDAVRQLARCRRTSRRARSCRRRASPNQPSSSTNSSTPSSWATRAMSTSLSSVNSKYVPSQLLMSTGRGPVAPHAAGEPLAVQPVVGVAQVADAGR